MGATFRSAAGGNNGSGTAASYAVTLPTGWAAEDIVLVNITVGVASAGFNALTGWALLNQDNNTGNAAFTSAVYYRRMRSGDTNPTFTSTTGNKAAWGAIAIQPAAGESLSLDTIATGAQTTTASTSVTPAANTATSTDCSVLLFSSRASANSATAVNVTPPTNWTEGSDSSTAVGTTSATRQVEAETSYRNGVTGTVTPGAASINVSATVNVYHYLIKAYTSAAIGSLTDDFDDNSIDTTKWPDNFGTVTETGGRARVTCDTGSNAYQSAPRYSLTESVILARVYPPAAGGGTNAWAEMFIASSSDDGTDAMFHLDMTSVPAQLQMALRVAFSDAGPVNITYDSTAHAWLRIRESAGTLYWETAPNAQSWTIQRSETTPAWAAYPSLKCQLSSHRDTGTTDFAEFDNFNVPGVSIWKPRLGPNYRR